MFTRSFALSLVLACSLSLAAAPAFAGYVAGVDDPWFEPNIPDFDGNSDPYTGGLQRTIDISGAPVGSVITEIELRLDLHHAYVGDLHVAFGKPGQREVIWDRVNQPDGDGIHRSIWFSDAFDGQNPNGTWTLWIKDMATDDTGELESWSINVWYSDCDADWDCGADELCVNGSCVVSTCGELGYPLGSCAGADADGQCSEDGFEVWECKAVGSLACWELREDCSIDMGICADPWLSAAACVYSGAGDFCAALGDYGYGCEHGESDCDSDSECVAGLECMGPIGGTIDGCCTPGEAWDGENCVTTSCVALGYPEGSCGSTGTDGECSGDFGKVLECTDIGPTNCWVVRETCAGSAVCWDSTFGAALCVGDGHDDYCAALVESGSGCLWGEADCDGDGECLGELECKGPLLGGKDGCCNADEDWNGAACVPTDCVTLGYPRGGCTTTGTDGRCSADGTEVWECIDAGTVNCWNVREACPGEYVCFDSAWSAAECIGTSHGDFCAALVAVGRTCGEGQSDCDSDAQCAEGLECQGPIWPLPGEDGCCRPDDRWDGETCQATCEQECVADTRGCANPTRKWTCGEADDADPCLDRIMTDCAANELCRDGRCVAATQCTLAADCPPQEHCAAGRCTPDVCPQEATYCRGPKLMQCNEDGSGASVVETCAVGAVCVDGACDCITDQGCAEDEYCAEQVDVEPFFADFTGTASEPAWLVGEGPLMDAAGTELCVLDPRGAGNAAEEGGAAALTVPAGHEPPSCARMATDRGDLAAGSYRFRLRAPADAHTEGEIALALRGTARISLRFQDGGQAVQLVAITSTGAETARLYALPFDGAASYHVYGFDWEAGQVDLVVDHVVAATVNLPTALPSEGGQLVITHWTAKAPHELAGPPAMTTTMTVDWLSWSPWPALCVAEQCPPGLLFCEGLEKRQCDARGTSSTVLETCNVNCSGGACVGTCVTALDCAAEEYCGGQGRCLADVCAQGAFFCVGDERRECRGDGSGSEAVEQCPHGCRTGECLPPGGCQDDAACDREQHCSDNGVCVADLCPQGRTFCAVLERRLCNANGSDSSLIETCGFGCEDGQCATECVDDSGCAAEQFCSDAGCAADVCPQGQLFCDNSERRRCADNGSGSSFVEVCLQGCTDGACNGGCQPACRGRECGDDGCGAVCGTCGAGWTCNAQGKCEQGGSCTPTCGTKECGDDGCGGSCGTCQAGQSCDAQGMCSGECTPDCVNRQCGDDGCGGTCGTCGAGLTCSASAQCVLAAPDAGGGTPGVDTTGGTDTGVPPFVGGDSSGGGCATGAGAPAAPLALLLLALLGGLAVTRRRRA